MVFTAFRRKKGKLDKKIDNTYEYDEHHTRGCQVSALPLWQRRFLRFRLLFDSHGVIRPISERQSPRSTGSMVEKKARAVLEFAAQAPGGGGLD
jgi:hypothetical protein